MTGVTTALRPGITVLVPAHNEAATIAACIGAIRASTVEIAAILVVADACSDDTAAIARAAGATVYETNCKDKAGAQNAVLPLVDTDLLVGFDGDTFPSPACIEQLVARLERDHLDAVCATVLPVQTHGAFIRSRQFAYALGRRWWRAAQSSVGRVQVLTGAAYLFRTDAIRSVGGFPSVGISADMDATWALHQAGYRLAYVGEAIAYTVDPETFDDYRQQMRRWSAGYFQTMAKHRRQLFQPRAALVVFGGLFDLVCLPAAYLGLLWAAIYHPELAYGYLAVIVARTLLNIVLVATVVGLRDALLGVGPYTLVNLYNKALYLWAFIREWILDSHYVSWTGRHGRAKEVTPIRPARAAKVGACLVGVVSVYCWRYGVVVPSWSQVPVVAATLPLVALFSIPSDANAATINRANSLTYR